MTSTLFTKVISKFGPAGEMRISDDDRMMRNSPSPELHHCHQGISGNTHLVVGRNDSKLIKLIMKQKWSELLSLLKRDGEAVLCVGNTSSLEVKYEDFHQGNMLHVICMYHPPQKVVHYVASLSPLLTIQVNSHKQTPLHVAAAHGANHRVIQTLLKHGGTILATAQDFKGRTPLHLHLKHCSSLSGANCDMLNESDEEYLNNNEEHVKLEVGPNIEVLRLLSEASPQCIHMQDYRGVTPMNSPPVQRGTEAKQRRRSSMGSSVYTQNSSVAPNPSGPSRMLRRMSSSSCLLLQSRR